MIPVAKNEMDVEALRATFLFQGVDWVAAASAIGSLNTSACIFEDGEEIDVAGHGKRSLGVLVRGGARYGRIAEDGRITVAGTMKAGDVFGAATLYREGSKKYLQVQAQGECRILFLEEALFQQLFARFPQITENYLVYLTERINKLDCKLNCPPQVIDRKAGCAH